MKRVELNPRLMRLFTWSGAFVVLIWVAALVGVMGFIPPHSPAESARATARFYAQHTTGIRLGCVLLMVSGCLWATFGTVITMLVRRMEANRRLLTYLCIALVGGGYVFFEFVPVFWVVAAFRPQAIDPDITKTLHDLGWFACIWTWPPFALFNIVIAIAILGDKNIPTVYPRWVGYFNLMCAGAFVPPSMIAFFKTGPFAYNGFVALYIPLGMFFVWMSTMTILTLQAITREQQRQPAPDPHESAEQLVVALA